MADQTVAQRPLGFYDQARQDYAASSPPKLAGEFLVGDWPEGGGCGPGGEFVVLLHDLAGCEGLSPEASTFGDAVGAFREAIDMGLLDALEDVSDPDAFSRRLIDLGFEDRSHKPLPGVSA